MIYFYSIMVSSFLMNCAWNANLTSILSTKPIVFPFNDLETLLSDTDFKVGIKPGTSHENAFKYATDELRQKAWHERIQPYLEKYRAYAGISINKFLKVSYNKCLNFSVEKWMMGIPMENPSIALYSNGPIAM